MAEAALRLDKLLWYLRLAPTRARAQQLAEGGMVRLNGRRIERAHCPARAGDILVLPWGQGARIVRVLTLPRRRGPAAEATACYEDLSSGAPGAASRD